MDTKGRGHGLKIPIFFDTKGRGHGPKISIFLDTKDRATAQRSRFPTMISSIFFWVVTRANYQLKYQFQMVTRDEISFLNGDESKLSAEIFIFNGDER